MNLEDIILLKTGGPTVNEGLATYYSKTATENLMDAEFRWLGEQGALSNTIQDRWMEYTTTLLFTGSLNDRLYQYWDSL